MTKSVFCSSLQLPAAEFQVQEKKLTLTKLHFSPAFRFCCKGNGRKIYSTSTSCWPLLVFTETHFSPFLPSTPPKFPYQLRSQAAGNLIGTSAGWNLRLEVGPQIQRKGCGDQPDLLRHPLKGGPPSHDDHHFHNSKCSKIFIFWEQIYATELTAVPACKAIFTASCISSFQTKQSFRVRMWASDSHSHPWKTMGSKGGHDLSLLSMQVEPALSLQTSSSQLGISHLHVSWANSFFEVSNRIKNPGVQHSELGLERQEAILSTLRTL